MSETPFPGFRPQSSGIDIDLVDRQIASGTLGLTFSEPLETFFESETGPERGRTFVTLGFIALCLYDFFLLNDWMAVPDMFGWLACARLLVFTPFLLFIIFMNITRSSWMWREIGAVCSAVLGVLLPMTIAMFSKSPDVFVYQLGSLLTMMFTTVVQRVRFRVAVVGIAVMLLIQMVTTWFAASFDQSSYGSNLLFFGTGSALLITAAYFLEKAERRSFLFALRGRLLNDQIERIARTDALTGLFNRRHLAQVTEAIWAAASDRPCLVSAIALDIDHFKAFNDHYGHLAGDDCLQAVGRCVIDRVEGTGGIAIRFGGEEILVVMPGTELAVARDLAEAIRVAIRALAIPHPVMGEGVVVTASVGVASVRVPQACAATLFAATDSALYAAKRTGRDRVCCANEAEAACSPGLSAAA